MTRKPYRIAIVGSYDPDRAEELNLKNWEIASEAGRQMGQKLAEKDFNIIVYASYPYLLEIDVVRGYLKHEKHRKACIEILYSQKSGQPNFIEDQREDDRFDPQAGVNSNWEVSFYQSLRDVDGVLLLGGGPSALIAGIVTISHRKPIVVCADFGGEGHKVWEALNNPDVLATRDEITKMARPWSANSSEQMISILEDQIKRKSKDNTIANYAAKS